ncbi:hypothetical protein JB92DRAFT_3100712 [Gautieria morchelliformis]|nr:hypothetical protein JB92DRAFT_3100712 [Gautieria morchelliformis]
MAAIHAITPVVSAGAMKKFSVKGPVERSDAVMDEAREKFETWGQYMKPEVAMSQIVVWRSNAIAKHSNPICTGKFQSWNEAAAYEEKVNRYYGKVKTSSDKVRDQLHNEQLKKVWAVGGIVSDSSGPPLQPQATEPEHFAPDAPLSYATAPEVAPDLFAVGDMKQTFLRSGQESQRSTNQSRNTSTYKKLILDGAVKDGLLGACIMYLRVPSDVEG